MVYAPAAEQPKDLSAENMNEVYMECARLCFTAKPDRIYTKHDFLTEGAHHL